MLASNGHRRSARAPGALSLAAVALVAAWSAGFVLSGSVMAAGENPIASTGVSLPVGYDPFDAPAPVIAAVAVAEKSTTSAVTVPPRNYDPFDLLSSAPAGGASTVVFQPGAPTLSEPLPMPQNADQKADGDAAAAANWSPTPLDQLSTNIVLPGGLLPRNYWADRPPQAVAFFDPCGATRGWPVSSLCWEASCFCHNPLYFEEINLERYGYGCCACLQPAVTCLPLLRHGAGAAVQDGRRLPGRMRLHARPLPAGKLPAAAVPLLLADQRPGRPLGSRRPHRHDLLDSVALRSSLTSAAGRSGRNCGRANGRA